MHDKIPQSISVVLLSWAKDDRLRGLTENAIRTCKSSETNVDFDIVVVETNLDAKPYDGARTIFLEEGSEGFNYNRAMNRGIRAAQCEFIACGNNDLIFHQGWATTIVTAMECHQLDSASPRCPRIHPRPNPNAPIVKGYRVRKELAGWLFVLRRQLWQRLGGLCEAVDFWYSDNVYAQQLIESGAVHALVCDSVVEHLREQTHTALSRERAEFLKHGQAVAFRTWKSSRDANTKHDM